MKHLITSITLLLSFFSITQVNQAEYKKLVDDNLSFYNYTTRNKNVISSELVDINLNKAFNIVAFDNSDLVSNGSAFGVKLGAEETTVSTGFNFLLMDKGINMFYGNIGLNATGSNNIFSVYDANSWSNDVGGSIGLIWKFPGSTYIDFGKYSEKEFNTHLTQRKKYLLKPLEDSNSFNNKRLKKIKAMLRELEEIDLGILKVTNIVNQELKASIQLIGLQETKEKLNNEKKEIEKYIALGSKYSSLNKKTGKAKQKEKKKVVSDTDQFISDRITAFDKKIDPTFGYRFWWLSGNLTINNSSYKFDDDNRIDSSAISSFKSKYDLEKQFNHIKTNLNFSLHFTRNGKKSISYASIGYTGYWGSFLENSMITGNPVITSDSLVFIDDNKRTFGTLDSLESQGFRYSSVNAYTACYFGKEKKIGWNVSFNHYFTFDEEVPQNYSFEPHFTLLTGPIFRRIKDDNTSLTFGLDIGWENAIYGNRITEDFTARIRVGIPFNIYTKEKID